jgi:hypothetical protein
MLRATYGDNAITRLGVFLAETGAHSAAAATGQLHMQRPFGRSGVAAGVTRPEGVIPGDWTVVEALAGFAHPRR